MALTVLESHSMYGTIVKVFPDDSLLDGWQQWAGFQNGWRSINHKSDSTITNVCLSVRLSVRLSVTESPQPLKIKPICHYSYVLISQIHISNPAMQLSFQSAIVPPPHISCQSAIIPISHNDPSAIMPPWHCCHYIYQLTDLLLRLLSHFGLFQIIKWTFYSNENYHWV